MQLPLQISLRPSRRLASLLAVVHCAAAASVLTLAFPPWLKLLLLGGLLFSLISLMRRLRRLPVSALILGAKGELQLETKVGARETVVILAETALLPGLIVLRLQQDAKRITLLVPADAADGDDLRRLRVWLTWRAAVNS